MVQVIMDFFEMPVLEVYHFGVNCFYACLVHALSLVASPYFRNDCLAFVNVLIYLVMCAIEGP